MDREELDELMNAFRTALPWAAIRVDEAMHGRGFEHGTAGAFLWFEAVADITNEDARLRKDEEVKRQLSFFSAHYDAGKGSVRNCIEVSYAENLMWNLRGDDKRWLWERVPGNLRALYASVWGEPDFDAP